MGSTKSPESRPVKAGGWVRAVLGAGVVSFGLLSMWIGASAEPGLEPPKLLIKAPEKVIDWAAATGEATAMLQGILRIRSVNPPGGEEAVARALAAICAKEGIEHELVSIAPGRVLLKARIPGGSSKDALCLTNHIDVVTADPAEWKVPPFSGKLVGERLYGRGALDMKGFAVMQLMTLILVKRRKLPLKRDLLFLALPDEEAGGRFGAQWVAKEGKRLLKGVSWMWNEGGMGTKGLAGIQRPMFGLMHAERGNLWIELEARGPSGHGSTAPDGNAIARLSEATRRIVGGSQSITLSPITRRLFAEMGEAIGGAKGFLVKRIGHPLVRPLLEGSFRKQRFLKAITRNTRTLTVFQAGSKVNVVPGKALARIDCRLLPGVEPESYLAGIKASIADLDITIRVINSKASTSSPVDGALFDAIRSTLTRLNPGCVVSPLLSPGGTDSAYFRPLGIKCYGLVPAVFSEADLKGFHGKDESITLGQIRQGLQATFEASVGFSNR